MIMPTKYLLRIFIKFLKLNKVYESYILNLQNNKGGQKEAVKFIVKYITYQPQDMIINAFPWRTPKHQKKTWSALHREWQMLLNKYDDN